MKKGYFMKKIIIVLFCAFFLAGCGKRGKLEFPADKVYPRQYPKPRAPKPLKKVEETRSPQKETSPQNEKMQCDERCVFRIN